MKFDIWVFLKKSVEKVQVSWKSEKNSEYLMQKPIYVFYHMYLAQFFSKWEFCGETM